MTLRRKTLAIIGLVLVFPIVILYIASQTILLASYEQLEQQNMTRNVQRAINTLNNILGSLSTNTSDYAFWDESYRFIQDGNEDYITSNLNDPAFVNLGLNLMVFANAENEVVFKKAVDLETGERIAFPTELERYLTPDSPLFQHVDDDSNITGIVLLDDGPLLLASSRILTSERQGPSAGSLIFGQFLNAAKLADIAEALQLPITLAYLNADQLTEDFRLAAESLGANNPIVVRALGADRIAGYTQINDLTGTPILLLRVDQPREIYAQGQATISLFMLLLVSGAVVFSGVVLLLLERAVLSRLERLSADVTNISASGNITARVSAAGTDELARLGQDINTMLERLETTQATLHESNQRLRAILSNAPILLWAVDNTGHLILMEGKDLARLGLESGNIIGKSIFDLYQYESQFLGEVRRALAGESFSSVVSIRGFTFDAYYTAVRDAEGSVLNVIGVATNITERVMAEEALGEAADNLEKQKHQLDRTRVLFRSTLEQLSDTLNRGADQRELIDYLQFMQSQFDRLDGNH